MILNIVTTQFLVSALTVMLSTAAVHGLWTAWAKYVAQNNPLGAGLSTVAIEVFGAYVVVEYVQDKRLIVAACFGSFFGAAAPVWRAKRRAKQ